MNRTDAPAKKAVPFAVNGQREALLATTPAGDNTASYDSGFPPVTMILKAAGGKPPKGQDMNQILYELALGSRWGNAGGGYGYDSDFATAIGGYPAGSMILSTDGAGYWLNTSESNSANPEVTNGSLTGWVPVQFYGSTSITGLTNSNVTLTSLQAARDRIELAGTLTGNINIVVPAWKKTWVIVNGTTGAFTVTVKTPSGTGISISSGKKATVYGDSVNITDVGYLQATNNLSEILAEGSTAQASARTNIGLGTAAVANIGTGVNQVPDMNSFPVLKAANGAQGIPGGFFFQTGIISLPASSTAATATVTFPIPFPNTMISAVATAVTADPASRSIGITSPVTSTSMRISYVSPSVGIAAYWIAIGY